MSSGPRTLILDIETSPNLAYVWSLFGEQRISLNQLHTATEMISFAAKWHGEKSVSFASTFHDGHDTLVEAARDFLDAADVIVHYNGKSFDIPHVNREIITAGLSRPSPFKQIDLWRTVKAQFKFPSNKLDYVAGALGLGYKTTHEGFGLWLKCMAGDEKAWALMRRYNKQDVVLTEQLYNRLLPWITQHPNVGAYMGESVCPSCGSKDLALQGHAYTSVGRYQRFKCGACGRWSRGNKVKSTTGIREVNA